MTHLDVIKNINKNSDIIYSLFKDNISYCFINSNLILKIDLFNQHKTVSVISDIQQTNHVSISHTDLFKSKNIKEYLSYIKNYIKDNNRINSYNFFLKKFNDCFPSYIYEYEMLKKQQSSLELINKPTSKTKIKN